MKNFDEVVQKWELILQKDSKDNITYSRNVLIEILSDFKTIKLNEGIVNEANRDVCPRCGSEDIVTTIYCNKCNKAM